MTRSTSLKRDGTDGSDRIMTRSQHDRFDDLAASFDRMRAIPPSALEHIADWVIRHTGATSATRIFEPGVGTGRIAAPFLRRGYHYTGLDLSMAMLRVLRDRPGAERCHLVQGDVRALPFADGSFDLVLTAHLLYLVDDWQGAVAEIRRVLRSGGSYLHCFERSTGTPAARALADHWQAAVGELAVAASWPASTTDTDVVAAFRAEGAMVTPATVARWARRRTLDRFLHRYAARMRPLYPDIQDDLFTEIVEDYLGWARRTYPHGATVGQSIGFEIHSVRWPSVEA